MRTAHRVQEEKIIKIVLFQLLLLLRRWKYWSNVFETVEQNQRKSYRSESFNNARYEVSYGTRPGTFDEVIVNDDLDFAFLSLRHILEERYPHLNAVPFGQHIEF